MGLTISGFYYVALHRLSGRIEALYYDPGSQPYQRLKMVPEAVWSVEVNEDCAEEGLELDETDSGRVGGAMHAGGLRSAFAVVQLR